MTKVFLKLGKVMGSSTDSRRVHWIELLSCSYAPRGTVPISTVPPPPGSNPPVELQCSKMFDASSGVLLRMASDGSTVNSATVDYLEDNGLAQSLSLSDVLLASFSTRRGPSNSVVEIIRLMCVIERGYPDYPPPPDSADYLYNPVTKRYER
jgi:type VI protein secretion system component Hcp